MQMLESSIAGMMIGIIGYAILLLYILISECLDSNEEANESSQSFSQLDSEETA